MRDQKLSSVALLRSSDLRKLAEETGRACDNLRKRWQKRVQPWLLQHYTGTCGFRIERVLTSLIAEQFSDYRGIDWYEIANQHKEFAGHTGSSLSSMFTDLLQAVKKSKKGGVVSLHDVANYAAKERKTSPNNTAQSHREAVILYFKEKVAIFGINVLLLYLVLLVPNEV